MSPSLLPDLRTDIGDETAAITGVYIPSGCNTVEDLRVDTGDDTDPTQPGVNIPSSPFVNIYNTYNTFVTISGTVLSFTEITTAGPYFVQNNDNVVFINKTVAEQPLVFLPSGIVSGQVITIKDFKGDAFINPIRIVPVFGTIDGQSSIQIQNNFASRTMVWTGSRWGLI